MRNDRFLCVYELKHYIEVIYHSRVDLDFVDLKPLVNSTVHRLYDTRLNSARLKIQFSK